MAGIGVKLNNLYEHKSILSHLGALFYSTVVTIAPMVIIILVIFLLEYLLGFDTLNYSTRELYSCTMLYIFIFSLITSSPFNAVLSKYMSDVIYDELYEEIMPCYYTGLLFNTIVSAIVGIPFVLKEYFVGGVEPVFIFMGYFGYCCLVWTFYTMLYLSICKNYGMIALFYAIGMGVMFLVSVVLVLLCGVPIIYGMMFGFDVGMFLVASLEYALVRSYFTTSSHNYKRVLPYFRTYAGLIFCNFFYILGLYIHNFVVWQTDLRMELVDCFICCQPYDMATFLALITNLSATVVFISNVERRFHDRYKEYSEAVIGGRLLDVERNQTRMFMQLSSELMSMIRFQFIVTVVLFLVILIVAPMLGISSLTMEMYPMLAGAYFVMFTMYSAIIFLYYYNDTVGAVLTTTAFLVLTCVLTMVFVHFDYVWYGAGLFIGSLVGWSIAYYRLAWAEKNLEKHIFCRGTILKKGKGERPDDVVYSK